MSELRTVAEQCGMLKQWNLMVSPWLKTMKTRINVSVDAEVRFVSVDRRFTFSMQQREMVAAGVHSNTTQVMTVLPLGGGHGENYADQGASVPPSGGGHV